LFFNQLNLKNALVIIIFRYAKRKPSIISFLIVMLTNLFFADIKNKEAG